MELTIEQMAAEIEQIVAEPERNLMLDGDRFIVWIASDHEFDGQIMVDELDEWGGSSIYIGRSAEQAARAISAERRR